jgi:hypothetical protein
MWDDRQQVSRSTDYHRLHFEESISNNKCRSNHGGLQSIHLLDVCVYHFHPEAVDREGRQSIIDRDDRRQALAVIIFCDVIISDQSSPYDVLFHRCKSVIYHDITCKMNPTTYANGRLGPIFKS